MKNIFTSIFLLIFITNAFGQAPDGGAIPYHGNNSKKINSLPVPQSSCSSDFYDGFESGNTNNFTLINGTKAASTNNPAFGTYCMELTTTVSSHYQGVNHIFTNALTPSHISLYMSSGNVGQHGPYFVIGDDNVSSNNGLCFVYFQFNASLIRVQTGSGDFTTPYVQDQWYHIEIKDIDWTNKTADLYVDKVLLANDFNFFFNGMSSVTNMHMWGWNGAISRYDSIAIDPGQGPATIVDSLYNVDCFGDSTGAIFTTTTGGDLPYTYAWNNNATTDDITGLSAGNYQLIVTDTSGCADTTDVTITENTEITGTGIPTDETIAGNDGSIDFTAAGGTPPYTYQWSNGDTTEDVDSLTGGTYTVTVTDSLGCEKEFEITVGSAVGINQQSSVQQMHIYPNPTSGTFTVKAPHKGQFTVTDAQGRLVTTGNYNQQTNLSQQAKGVYLVNLHNGQTRKLVLVE